MFRKQLFINTHMYAIIFRIYDTEHRQTSLIPIRRRALMIRILYQKKLELMLFIEKKNTQLN